MSLYLDSSALLKRYVRERQSEALAELLAGDEDWITGRHTYVEVRRNLARLLSGTPLRRMQRSFFDDWETIHVIELDEVTCETAAELAELTGTRTLDALHLAAARRLAGLTFVTYDLRQAQAARSLGMLVVGV